MLREGAEREVRATDVVLVVPFGDDAELLLAGGQKYRLEKPGQILVRLKVEQSGSIPSLSFQVLLFRHGRKTDTVKKEDS